MAAKHHQQRSVYAINRGIEEVMKLLSVDSVTGGDTTATQENINLTPELTRRRGEDDEAKTYQYQPFATRRTRACCDTRATFL